MKDNFSSNSAQYKQFRPTYLLELYDFIFSHLNSFESAWDCGTGNGQIATQLAHKFKQVSATDISSKQLENAEQVLNISYSVQAAEKTSFPENHFDLICVGQAIHWFDFEQFYAEVHRTAKKNALLALIGYGNIQIDAVIDPLIEKLYTEILGDYWDSERKYIDENYTTIPFPFEEIAVPTFENSYEWNLDHLLGYLQTWSGLKHYVKQHNTNPLRFIEEELKLLWPENEIKKVNFPLLVKLGRIKKTDF